MSGAAEDSTDDGGSEKKLTAEEVLHEIAHRDRREYPVMTITQVAERFDDVTRKTVQRRVRELVEEGRLRERKLSVTGTYWIPHDDTQGVCPECGGVLAWDEEYEPGLVCRSCQAIFGEMDDGEGITRFGESVNRGGKMVVWWSTLPSFVQSLIAGLASRFLTDEEYPDEAADYRPENVVLAPHSDDSSE